MGTRFSMHSCHCYTAASSLCSISAGLRNIVLTNNYRGKASRGLSLLLPAQFDKPDQQEHVDDKHGREVEPVVEAVEPSLASKRAQNPSEQSQCIQDIGNGGEVIPVALEPVCPRRDCECAGDEERPMPYCRTSSAPDIIYR